ncbi:hypothetical protein F7725_018899 [Dissostichus mawsoni]|uniref:Mitochondrial folate transporter/carrier n=1 Tax=Dissostichus mawsoni TaxID=36200 RepID=A0A7J5XSX3_DISMA|nr:hypothetical protein F7725_018899 [Dissostichus mawsoni]
MSSAPNHGTVNVTETESSKPVSAVSLAGHVKQVLGHVKIENLVAGLSGGVVSTMMLHPLDLVKIRFAVSDGLDLRPKYSGIMHCMKSVWQQEGLRGLYQGVTPNIWGAGASWGLYFFFYNAIKGYTKEGRQTELSATEHLGYVPGLFGTSHGALQFMAYEELKRDYNKYRKAPSDAKLSAWEYITMAALSKIFAVATTYPYQVVRARLQDQHNTYNGVIDVVRRTWRNEGAIGFYKGIIPNVIRVTPACCITFVVYENVSRYSEQFTPTDSHSESYRGGQDEQQPVTSQKPPLREKASEHPCDTAM